MALDDAGDDVGEIGVGLDADQLAGLGSSARACAVLGWFPRQHGGTASRGPC